MKWGNNKMWKKRKCTFVTNKAYLAKAVIHESNLINIWQWLLSFNADAGLQLLQQTPHNNHNNNTVASLMFFYLNYLNHFLTDLFPFHVVFNCIISSVTIQLHVAV